MSRPEKRKKNEEKKRLESSMVEVDKRCGCQEMKEEGNKEGGEVATAQPLMAGMTLPAPPAAGGDLLGGLPDPVDSVPQKTPPAGILIPVGVSAPSDPL